MKKKENKNNIFLNIPKHKKYYILSIFILLLFNI